MKWLLCDTCNLVLGLIKDNPKIAKALYKYLLIWRNRVSSKQRW